MSFLTVSGVSQVKKFFKSRNAPPVAGAGAADARRQLAMTQPPPPPPPAARSPSDEKVSAARLGSILTAGVFCPPRVPPDFLVYGVW